MLLLRTTIITCVGFVLAFACEPEQPPDEPPELEVELLGCIDEPQPWDTCADFCAWDGAVCAENGCEGITARSYPYGYGCLGVENPYDDVKGEASFDSPFGCDDELVFDEFDRRYYNCCCDYR
ncbi:hypothetical protein ACNOYE_14095 [Nannocystaceae bacterium ST9]